MKKLWLLIFLVLLGCSNKGFDTVTSVSLANFDKKEVAFYKEFSVEKDGFYTVSMLFYHKLNDERGLDLIEALGIYYDENKMIVNSGAPIYTYIKVLDSDGRMVYENVDEYPITNAMADGRYTSIGATHLDEGEYKILFYAKQKHLIFRRANAVLAIGDVLIAK